MNSFYTPIQKFFMPSQKPSNSSDSKKKGLHPRNRHTGRYDFKKLIKSCPDLEPFVALNPYNELSVDFSDPLVVRTLNRALLKLFYNLSFWEIPADFLCPPIPGRADYIHNVADLLSSCNQGVIPRGPQVRVLDIGVGASCIYPIIGNREYGWNFLGSDIDSVALASAKLIVDSNVELADAIELRKQVSPEKVFDGLILSNEEFDLTLCNPPFHRSLEEAREGSRRKWKNLGREPDGGTRRKNVSRIPVSETPLFNFGGKGSELWCLGGETAFINNIIQESTEIRAKVFWFSTLVSKEDALTNIYQMLKHANVNETRTIEMSQGQKRSRIVAWTYLSTSERKSWRARRWAGL